MLAQLGEFKRHRGVYRFRVTYGIADVVRERADSEGQFIWIPRVAQQAANEIRRSDVVRQIAKKLVAERIVAEILDGRAAVGIGVRLSQFGLGRARKPAEQ